MRYPSINVVKCIIIIHTLSNLDTIMIIFYVYSLFVSNLRKYYYILTTHLSTHQWLGRWQRWPETQVQQTRVALVKTWLIQVFQAKTSLHRRVGRNNFDERISVTDGRQIVRYERLQPEFEFCLLRVVPAWCK